MTKINTDKKRLGSIIKEKRCSLKLSQRALSEKAGLSRSYLADIEAGRYYPSLMSISKIAIVLELDLNCLFSMSEIQGFNRQLG
jgi:transcriptional regulator with XRE-family HTH domain